MGAAACEVLTLLVLAAIVEQATGFIAPGIGRLRHCQGTTEGMARGVRSKEVLHFLSCSTSDESSLTRRRQQAGRLSRDEKLQAYKEIFSARQQELIDIEDVRQSVYRISKHGDLSQQNKEGQIRSQEVKLSQPNVGLFDKQVADKKILERIELNRKSARIMSEQGRGDSLSVVKRVADLADGDITHVGDGFTAGAASSEQKKVRAEVVGDEGKNDLVDPIHTTGMPAPLARLLVLGAAALYGTNFGSVKLLEESLDPSLAASLRFSLAALVMSPLLRNLRPEILKEVLPIGVCVSAGYIAQGLSLQTADASTAAFLCSLAVIVCPMIDVLNGKSVSKTSWAAAMTAVVGAGVLELGGGSAPGYGDFLALLQPLAFGIQFWAVERAMRKYPDQAGPIAALQLCVVALTTNLWSFAEIHHLPSVEVLQGIASQPSVVAALLWTGLVTTAFTVFLETIALGSLSSCELTVLFATEPLWGTAFAHTVLGEQIGANTVIGGALIMTACFGNAAGPQAVKAYEGVADRCRRNFPHVKQRLAALSAYFVSQGGDGNV